MSEKKTYCGSGGSTTGTSGFTNYFGGGDVCAARTRAAVWRDHPDAVILNGNDNWNAPPIARIPRLCNELGIEVIALFHTGISGIMKTGVVLSKEAHKELKTRTREKYGREPNARTYFNDEYGLTGILDYLEVRDREYEVRYAVAKETDEVTFKLRINNHKCGVTYRLEGDGVQFRAINERTGRPATGKFGRARFGIRGERVFVVERLKSRVAG